MKNEQLARDFMLWFAANIDQLKRYVKDYDDDLFNDAFLRAYNAILRRGTEVKDYTGYFLQTYRATFLDSTRKAGRYGVSLDMSEEPTYVRQTLAEIAHLDGVTADQYEEEVEAINDKVLAYVRNHFDPYSTSLFEIYLGLSPAVSYTRLATLLGISEHKIRHRIRPIRKALSQVFGPTLAALNQTSEVQVMYGNAYV